MTDYIVRTTGSDAADGLTPATAWLTVDHAANNVSPGDNVYIGTGVYRELVTMDTSGTAGNQISFIADIDGSRTGDSGLVTVTAHDDDAAAPARVNCLDFQDKEFITWRHVVFSGGTGDVISGSTATHLAYEEVLFDGCVVVPYDTATNGIFFDLNQGATPAVNGLRFMNCRLMCGIFIWHDGNPAAEQNARITIDGCEMSSLYRVTLSRGIAWWRNAAGTNAVSGLTVKNCTLSGCYDGVSVNNVSAITDLIEIHNNWFINCNRGIYRVGGTQSSVVSDNNSFTAVATPLSNVSQGASDALTGSFGLVGGIADLPLKQVFGHSVFKSGEPISMNGYTNPLIGAADPAFSSNTDIYGNPRPMGRNGIADIGAVEARSRPKEESTVVGSGLRSARMEGNGYYDSFHEVSAAATTVSVQLRRDANYTGTLPQIEIRTIPGVADQTSVATGAADTWEQVTAVFTPTAAGIIWVRIRGLDTSASGNFYFDELAVT